MPSGGNTVTNYPSNVSHPRPQIAIGSGWTSQVLPALSTDEIAAVVARLKAAWMEPGYCGDRRQLQLEVCDETSVLHGRNGCTGHPYDRVDWMGAGGQIALRRLGGRTAIVAVVDEFVANCAGDARINKFFAATAADPKRLATFKNNLVDQVCEASGRPCKYTGKDMKSAHAGLGDQQR